MLHHWEKLLGPKDKVDFFSCLLTSCLGPWAAFSAKFGCFHLQKVCKCCTLSQYSLTCKARWLWFGNRPFMLVTGINLSNLKFITGISGGKKDNLVLIVIVSSDVDSRLSLSCQRLVQPHVIWKRQEGVAESYHPHRDVFALLLCYLFSLETS